MTILECKMRYLRLNLIYLSFFVQYITPLLYTCIMYFNVTPADRCHRGGTLPWLCYSVTPDSVILLWRISMGNRVRYVLMLVFPIPSKSLKNEIVVAVGESMEHLLTPKLRPKALPFSHRPHEVPLKVTFSNKIGNLSLFHFHMELACEPRRPKR